MRKIILIGILILVLLTSGCEISEIKIFNSPCGKEVREEINIIKAKLSKSAVVEILEFKTFTDKNSAIEYLDKWGVIEKNTIEDKIKDMDLENNPITIHIIKAEGIEIYASLPFITAICCDNNGEIFDKA